MDELTPKQRYDARMKLKRQAREPGYKADDAVQAEYAFDLAERFITALESYVRVYSRSSNR